MDDQPSATTRAQQALDISVLEQSFQALQLARQAADLCKVCSAINFKQLLSSGIATPVTLGTWISINQRWSCRFCRLVVRSLTLKQVVPARESEIILRNAPSWELAVEHSPYDRLRSDIFSNKLDLKSRAKDEDRTSYRLLVVSDNCPAKPGLIQYIPDRLPSKLEQAFCGRAIQAEFVDIGLLNSWLDRCVSVHGKNCNDDGVAGRELPQNLRLIDVDRRAILKAEDVKLRDYVTLSYVWGTDRLRGMGLTPVVLERGDIQYIDGVECTPISVQLPQTIEDAITLTRKLGFKFLWVDALCIVQDETPEEKRPHLDLMHAIYNCSALTIVAGSGPHANAGLAGVSIPRHRSQGIDHVNGLPLAAMAPSYTELENSSSLPWNLRAWTFQEKVLAKRIMLFTDYQVYFKCSEAIWTEEVVLESNKLSKNYRARPQKYRWAADRPQHIPIHSRRALLLGLIMPKLDGEDQWKYLGPFPDYAAATQEYTKRTLTDRGDILLAINGVFKTLEKNAGTGIVGHPSGYFAQSLLWHPRPGSEHELVDLDLPSWSWAAWRNSDGIIYDVLDIRLLRTVMLVLRKVLQKTIRLMERLGERPSGSSTSTTHDSGSSLSSLDTSSPSSSSHAGPSKPSSTLQTLQNFSMTETFGFNPASVAWRATKNIAACFGWPVLIRGHTVKAMYLCESGHVVHIPCAQTMSMSTFISDDIHDEKQDARQIDRETSADVRHELRRIARTHTRPVTYFKTTVVKFYVGNRLSAPEPRNADEAGLYELLGMGDCVVGEAWLTSKVARRGRRKGLDFLTICWGLSLTACELDDEYVPKWTFDAADLPKSESVENILPVVQQAFEAPRPDINGDWPAQPSVASFVGALLTAKKGEPRPRFLWSVVNLLAVKWENGVAHRVGVGKVIFMAWQMQLLTSQAEDVRLV